VKNRQRILKDEKVKMYLTEINQSIAKNFKVKIIEEKVELDHIHIIFSSKPQIRVSAFINSLKSVTARKLMLEFPYLKNKIQTEGFWEPNYFLASVGEVEPMDIRLYIDKYKINQEDKK
jgi:putative transposase